MAIEQARLEDSPVNPRPGQLLSAHSRGRRSVLPWLLGLALLVMPALAQAAPRSGASFGGRLGFRNGGGFSTPRSSGNYGYNGGGHSFFFLPSFGWGGYGYGGGFG